MRKEIILMNYHFSFAVIQEERCKYVDVTYYDETRPESVIYTVVHEDLQRDVLPYKPDFNAENAVQELPLYIFDDLYNNNMLTSLQGWLQTNYSQLAFMEVINND